MIYKRKWGILFVVVLFLISILSIGIAAEIKVKESSVSSSKKSIAKKGIARKGKVEGILSKVSKASSFATITEALSKAKLSDNEINDLGKKLRSPLYSGKFQQLLSKANGDSQKKAKAKSKVIQKKEHRKYIKKQNRTLEKLNQNIHRKLARMRTVDKPASGSIMTPVSSSFSAQGRIEIEDLATVESIIPQPVAVGREIHIRGENFGRTGRKVKIRTDLGVRELLVLSWHDDSIVAKIRANVHEIIGESEKEARILVEATKNTAVGFARVLPDPSRMSPHVTEMPDEFTPGRYIIIEGRNFLSERRGSVEFRIGSNIFEGQVYEWLDNAIDVRLQADVSGLQRRDATVVIRNHAGNETSTRITFEPSKTIRVIYTVHTYAPYEGNDDFVWCASRGRIYTDHDFDLLNGYTVSDFYLEDEPHYGNTGGAGSWFRERPTIGATNGKSRVEISVNSLVGWRHTATNFLIVEGPYGLDYE